MTPVKRRAQRTIDTAAERLHELSETLERVTPRLEDVGANAAEAAPADGALAYS